MIENVQPSFERNESLGLPHFQWNQARDGEGVAIFRISSVTENVGAFEFDASAVYFIPSISCIEFYCL